MSNNRYKILWADDEIDLLKPHILFLNGKGYDVTTANNGRDALDLIAEGGYDLVILDEHMPGLSGLETLAMIKQTSPLTPVIMITKSEEENIMNQAIGSKIADYLIKPVNPNQILLSPKKALHSDELVSRQATSDYRKEFGRLSLMINECRSINDWYALYDRIVYWEMELSSADTDMNSLLLMQKDEANAAFSKFLHKNYGSWMEGKERPLMSNDVFKHHILPHLDSGEKVMMLVIDNLRLDQWRAIKPLLGDMFSFEESLYTSILPTATQYARNALFSGLMPRDIASLFPDLWMDEDADESKNINEASLIATQFQRFRRDVRFSYHKINDSVAAERLVKDFANLEANRLNVVVCNFIDIMSHARTDSRMMRELASSDAAYRSLTESWLRHSPVLDLLRKAGARGHRIVITTDHGSIKVNNAVKVVGDRNTNTNLRYKVGKNLDYNPRQVYEIKHPERYGLPSPNVSSTYIFASGRDFFAYPNNYNHYVQYYDNTFQHGGISLEEMLVPIVILTPKSNDKK